MLKRANMTIVGVLLFSGLIANSQDKPRPLNVDPNARSVQGVVTYAAHEPVKGAIVKCEDTKTLVIRSYITGADGKYHFMNLSTNTDYELHAEKSGRESHTERLSQFNEHKVAIINLRLR